MPGCPGCCFAEDTKTLAHKRRIVKGYLRDKKGLTLYKKSTNIWGMKKTQAVYYFGGKAKDLAKALGISKQAFSAWPEDLPGRRENEILGVFARHGTYTGWLAFEKVAGNNK